MAVYEGAQTWQFWTEYLGIKEAEWVVDPFAPKFYSPIQGNIRLNFGEWLNLVTCEQGLRCDVMVLSQ